VGDAVNQTCSTADVKDLALQLVEEINCLKPDVTKKIDNLPGVALGSGASAIPYLQSATADAVVKAQKARGVTLNINSGLRTLPQQFLLYRWYVTGRCGIGLAAKPGTSNHESGLAVDIADNAAWRTAMDNSGFRWLGASDPVHYDYLGAGAVNIRGLSVKAFQRLWNRNHADDPIGEDGNYGADTEKRLAMAPVGGFEKGALASCSDDAGADAGLEPADVPPTPDADEPADTPKPAEDPNAAISGGRNRASGDGGGCNVSALPTANATFAMLGLAIALITAIRRRR
jgi:hypothetical protein